MRALLLVGLTKESTVLLPKPTIFSGTATYRLTALAQTAMVGGPISAVIRKGLPADKTTLAAGSWLTTPVNVNATRTTASWDLVSGAGAYSAVWSDATGELLEVTVLSPKKTSLEVPNAVALPSSGTLTAKVQALGADFDLNDFSLEEDSELLWGVSTQPVTIP